LADLEVTAKAVERVTEMIGTDIARRQQEAIRQTMQLELPVAVGQAMQKIYIPMDGTGLPMVARETAGRTGKGQDGPAHPREAKLDCVFPQTIPDDQGRPVHDEPSTTYPGATETAAEFSRRLYPEAHQRGWSRARVKGVMGDGADLTTTGSTAWADYLPPLCRAPAPTGRGGSVRAMCCVGAQCRPWRGCAGQ
jgi:hypothetical protein